MKIVVCDGLRTHFEYMIIDEERTHVLTKYCTRRGIRSEIGSDHNVQFAKFILKYHEAKCKTIREIFNFKNTECQQKFFEVTDNSSKLSSCFSQCGNFIENTSKFVKILNGTFHQCFRKIRIKNKTSNVDKKDVIQVNLSLKTKLQMFLKDARSDYSRQVIQRKLIEINDTISSLTSSRNKNIIDEQFKNIKNTDGTFNRIGM